MKAPDSPMDAGRFIEIRFDAGLPLRPQFDAARDAVTTFALAWLKDHDAKPLRIGKTKSQAFYAECRAIDAEMRRGVDRDLIGRQLWPELDGDLRRRRLNYRIARWRLLVEGHYLGDGETSDNLVFPCMSTASRVR